MATTFRDKIKARKAKEKAEAEAKANPPEPTKPSPKKGFFDAFLNRGDAIDAAIDGEVDRMRKNQNTDGNN